MISVHVEVLPHLHRTIGVHQEPRREGRRRAQPVDAGRQPRGSRRPTSTSCSSCRSIPGSAARPSSPAARPKYRRCGRCWTRPATPAPIEVDGGIDQHNDRRRRRRRARTRSSPGSAIFGSPDPERAAREPEGAGRGGGAGAPRRARGAPLSAHTSARAACACATPKPTRWASSYYANYLAWFEVGRCEWLRSRAGPTARWRTRRDACCRSSRRTATTGSRRATTMRSRSGRRGELLSPVRVRVRLRGRATRPTAW